MAEYTLNKDLYGDADFEEMKDILRNLKAKDTLYVENFCSTNASLQEVDVIFTKDEYYYPEASADNYPEYLDGEYDPDIDYKTAYNSVQLDVYIDRKNVATSYDIHVDELDLQSVYDGSFKNFIEENRDLKSIINGYGKAKEIERM